MNGETQVLLFDAENVTLTGLTTSASLPRDSYRTWVTEICRDNGLTAKRYETPSAPDVVEFGCYTQNFFATCIPGTINACVVMYSTNGLPESIPQKHVLE